MTREDGEAKVPTYPCAACIAPEGAIARSSRRVSTAGDHVTGHGNSKFEPCLACIRARVRSFAPASFVIIRRKTRRTANVESSTNEVERTRESWMNMYRSSRIATHLSTPHAHVLFGGQHDDDDDDDGMNNGRGRVGGGSREAHRAADCRELIARRGAARPDRRPVFRVND